MASVPASKPHLFLAAAITESICACVTFTAVALVLPATPNAGELIEFSDFS